MNWPQTPFPIPLCCLKGGGREAGSRAKPGKKGEMGKRCFYICSYFWLFYSVIDQHYIKLIFPSLFCLWWQLASDPSLSLSWCRSFSSYFFPLCPIKDEWWSSLVRYLVVSQGQLTTKELGIHEHLFQNFHWFTTSLLSKMLLISIPKAERLQYWPCLNICNGLFRLLGKLFVCEQL